MEEYVHHLNRYERMPGMRLAPGAAIIQKGDVYSAPNGVWMPSLKVGHVIEPTTPSIWVRPGVSLSGEARAFLVKMINFDLCVTKRDWEWTVISASPYARFVERINWPCPCPMYIEELRDYGFIGVRANDNAVYEITDSGRRVANPVVPANPVLHFCQ